MNDAVKINPDLKKRVERLIDKGDMQIEYPSLKNFVDRAILRQVKKIEEKNKHEKK